MLNVRREKLMKYRRVGRSGLMVSSFTLGGWSSKEALGQLDEGGLSLLLSEAFERGINGIDLADIYEQGDVEVLFGRVLREYPRHQLVLSSKCYWPMSQGINDRGLSRKHLFESVEGSLRRLQTDYLDIFICHHFDQDTPLDETIRALGDLMRLGKILYWGVCGWKPEQLEQTLKLCHDLGVAPPIIHHLLYHPLERGIEHEVMEKSAELGLGIGGWGSLAGGLFAGESKDFKMSSRESWYGPWQANLNTGAQGHSRSGDTLSQRWVELAHEAGLTPAQLALAWSLRRREVSTLILSVSSTDHLRENVGLFDRPFDLDLLDRIDQLFPL